MKVVVTGDTVELILIADILSKLDMIVELNDDASRACDVLVWSSEASEESSEMLQEKYSPTLICDISDGRDACDDHGPVLKEFEIQATTGLVDTTGLPDSESVRSGVPFVAVSTALYAASAILVATLKGMKGQIHVSRYLSAVGSLTTFLPAALLGNSPSRIGNAHPASSPWNAYPTSDGWLLICTSKDEQWKNLCSVALGHELEVEHFRLQSDRVRLRDKVDAALSNWTRSLTTDECAKALIGVGVPVGPILRMNELHKEQNIQQRQPALMEAFSAKTSGSELFKHLTLFEDHPFSKRKTKRAVDLSGLMVTDKPLSGLKVIEIGQFTAVPLAGRHLAHLGADVLKVEPPGGEAARRWAPLLGGTSHYFTISNSGKRIVQLDFNDAESIQWLKQEIVDADVLIENLRPGVLEKFGFSQSELERLNPRLVTCSVSGFGANSAYPGRAAFDTVIQGMSGIMDLTRGNAGPVKLGISAADILGAQTALLGVLNGLLRGGGRFVDVAMQDVSVYAALASGIIGSAGPSNIPVRTVRELAENARFKLSCLADIPDEKGVLRPSIKMPYRFEV